MRRVQDWANQSGHRPSPVATSPVGNASEPFSPSTKKLPPNAFADDSALNRWLPQ